MRMLDTFAGEGGAGRGYADTPVRDEFERGRALPGAETTDEEQP